MSGDNEFTPIKNIEDDERVKSVALAFKTAFDGDAPDFCVRVPGRVNLIGEHVDYCGYGVCPMALELNVIVAVKIRDTPVLNLKNAEAEYQPFSCNLPNFEICVKDAPHWYQYFLCGVKHVLDNNELSTIKGMDVFVSGNIPPSSGLSSSSAFVCASLLATLHVYKIERTMLEVATAAAKCEQYIGTQGGGMDHAIAILAKEGYARFIEFNPLRSKPVRLPKGAVFVISQSTARLNKAATADFNTRVFECRIAAKIIGKCCGLIEWEGVNKLGDLQKQLGKTLSEMLDLVFTHIHENPYTRSEIDQLEVIDPQQLNAVLPDVKVFKLFERATHVFSEALRVDEFVKMCCEHHQEGDEEVEASLKKMGELMSGSHQSLRDLYECSHEKLDRIVELSRGVAKGARLTGAGWGGCAVALVDEKNVQKYIDTIKENFYKPLGITQDLDKLIFATEPSGGACKYT